MDTDRITVLNTRTGQVGQVRRKHFDNPVINTGYLVEVEPNTKPYNSALWTPRTAKEYLEQRDYTRLGDVYPVELPDEETDTEEEEAE